jgi:hypothetical protein
LILFNNLKGTVQTRCLNRFGNPADAGGDFPRLRDHVAALLEAEFPPE